MTHLHITSWGIAIILFIIAVILQSKQNDKAARITKMILRVFYLLVILTGIYLYVPATLYHIKSLAGILVIVLMEWVLAGYAKGKSTTIPWILLLIVFVFTVYLGLTLPMGILLGS